MIGLLVIDYIFTYFQLMCCGVDGPGDWKNITGFDQGQYPDSCCKVMKEGCGVTGGVAYVQVIEI